MAYPEQSQNPEHLAYRHRLVELARRGYARNLNRSVNDKKASGLRIEEVRRDLLSWTIEAQRHNGWRPARHHRFLIERLNKVARGECPRLMVFMPPGSAKSTYTSHLFSTWMFQHRPGIRIVGASHTSGLAIDFSAMIQQLVRENEEFLGYGLLTENKQRWRTTNGGSYLAAGVGNAIPGYRADLAILDDPVKSRQAADSEADRKAVWDWYLGSLERRLTPGAAIIVILCMAGDTPVLMANGTELPLRDVRPGDEIATYENGKIRTSTVRNWANQGPDNVFAIRMKSGITVRANARHPFLVCENGEEKWQRTDLLKKGSVILRAIGESGRGSLARQTDATSQQSAGECVRTTMERPAGLRAIDHHLLILNPIARRICVIVTELISQTMSVCFPNRVVFAPSAESYQFQDTRSTSVLTTTTLREKYEDCCAITAISWSGKGKQKRHSCGPLDTFEITHDVVEEVVACGVEDVFDIQVDRTANFIANGLISHNTRWHEDDVAGRLLEVQRDKWEVINLPAEAEEGDQLGRRPGEWLWSDDAYGYGATLAGIKDDLEKSGATREWAAQYQQRPRPLDGALFKVDRIGILPACPAGGRTVRAYDLAATRQSGTRDPDWTRGVKMTMLANRRIVIEDVVGARGAPDDVERIIVNTAGQDGRKVKIGLPQDPGQAGKSQVAYFVKLLNRFHVATSPETGDKATRAGPFASQVNVGNVDLVEGPWNRSYLDELASFPVGSKSDQVDASSRAYSMLTEHGRPLILSPQQRQRVASTPTHNRHVVPARNRFTRVG